MKRKNQGFTFIEVLVTISIIAIISAMALATYSRAQKKSRDAKREVDLKQIQIALEMCKTDEGSYPSGDGFLAGSMICGTKTYMSEVPVDPSSPDQDYTYAPGDCGTGDCYSYSLCADKELPEDSTSYCVVNP